MSYLMPRHVISTEEIDEELHVLLEIINVHPAEHFCIETFTLFL